MKILIACSGSGGHVFPALALAQKLKERNAEILFLQTNRDKTDELIKSKGFNRISSKFEKVSFDSFKSGFISMLKLLFATISSIGIISKLKPAVVIGFGGYHSGPIIVVSHFLGIPTIIHEQNVLPGKANQILSKFTDKVAVSFEETKQYFKPKRIVFTGCPLRPEITNISVEEARAKYSLSENKFTIMVMGGSQGSRNINTKFIEAVSMLDCADRLQVIHITGSEDYENVSRRYSEKKISSLVFAFLEEIGYAYKLADIIISRSGASTVSEVISLGIPSIMIPYPYAKGHQLLNAKILSDAGCAILIKEKDLSAEKLKESIVLLLNNKEKLSLMQQAFRKFQVPDAVNNLEREVLSLIR